MRRWQLSLLSFCTVLLAMSLGESALGQTDDARQRERLWKQPWSQEMPQISEPLRAGQPLTVLVFVPLCDSGQIACGGQGAGDPASLRLNLYWGRAFGARRYFDETARGWQRVSLAAGEEPVLEQVVYRRSVSGKAWGISGALEQLLILRAIHGRSIEKAVDEFFAYASAGGTVSFSESGRERVVPVHVSGYAGHNRLMDGYRLGAPHTGTPIPAFVFACRSDPYFSAALCSAGALPLLMTRDLMAPEGYIIEAIANALGDNVSRAEVRQRVVRAYAKYQRIPERVASSIFARL